MTPIRIKSPDADMEFSIDGEFLRADGKIHLHGRQTFSFPLRQIAPEPFVLERRHPWFRQGFFATALAIAAIFFLSMLEDSKIKSMLISFMITFVLIGTVLMVAFRSRYQFLTFLNTSGNGLFTIVRTPRNKRMVDSLVRALEEHAPASPIKQSEHVGVSDGDKL